MRAERISYLRSKYIISTEGDISCGNSRISFITGELCKTISFHLCRSSSVSQSIDEQQPRHAVVDAHGDEVVYRRYQRAGRHRGVNADAFEYQRYRSAGKAGDYHGYAQRYADAARRAESERKAGIFEKVYIKTYENKRAAAEHQTVAETDAHLFEYQSYPLLEAESIVGYHPYRYGKRLCSGVARHVEYERLKTDYYSEFLDYAFKQSYYRRYAQRLVEIFFGGKTCQLGVVFAHFVVYRLNDVLRGDDPEDRPAFV